jgi:hypothetical protein
MDWCCVPVECSMHTRNCFEIPTKEDCWETQYWAQVNHVPTNILWATNFPRDIRQ